MRLRLHFLGLFTALTLAFSAAASKPRLRLERLDASSFASDGTVRVFASVVELEGNVDDNRATPAFELKMNGKNVGRPVKAQQFQGAGEPLDLVLVVESSALYGPKKIVIPPPPPPKGQKRGKQAKAAAATSGKGNKIAADVLKQIGGGEPLDKVKDALHALLEGLSPRVRVLLIDYGGDMTPHTPWRPAPAVENDVDDLLPDGDAGDLTLGPAIREALKQLSTPRPDGKLARRLIVVVSDGLNSQMDRRTFKTLGDAAAHEHVPIHTIAFSPTDERGPLLNLGEISKRSNGTFRWARTADDLRAQIDTLTDELNKQYVLTYKIDTRSLEGKTFQLTCEELTSNTLVYDSSGGAFGLAPATRPLLPWWAWGILGMILFGGGALVVMARRPKKVMRFSPYKQGAATASQPRPTAQTQPQAHVQPQPHVQPQAPAQAASAPPVVRAPTRGLLIVVSGARAGERIDVGAQPVSIGKGPSTLQITDDPTVSTRHAELALRGGAFVVTDLGSTNGTFVNNQRIAQPTRINDGDLLRCGNTQLKFRAD